MRALTRVAAVALLVSAIAGCSDDGGDGAGGETPDPAELAELDGSSREALAAEVSAAPGCDPLDPARCLLPFPSDAHTVDDPDSETGRRLALPAEGMPVNAEGVAVDPTEWNRNDGFSPTSTILTHVAGLDAGASRLPSWTDLAASLDEDATVVLVDLDTGERVPAWAELDARPADDAERLLMIHPAVALPEGHRVAVALRALVRADGSAVEPSVAFRAYRDRLATELDPIEARRPAMEALFDALAEAGVDRDDLVLAWDFTVASERSLSERMLHIRDEALTELDAGPVGYTVTEVAERPHEDVAISVIGTFEVPNFLTGDGGPGNGFAYAEGDTSPDRLPVRNGTLEAPFACQVSNSTASGAQGPGRIALYGHGLLGSVRELQAGNVRAMAEEHNVVFCATLWAGMSELDIPNAVVTLGDVSNFPTVADRLQQGVLNQIVLGRLMLDPGGLLADPAFGGVDVDRSRLVFDGNSQGGIMGGMLAAVSPDVERAVLGVPGMDYSLLLYRSVDWDDYETILEPAYPSAMDRAMIVSIIQLLWDRGEAAGYAQHLGRDPYPGSAGADVLLHVAFGDQQVTELAAMIEARTIGARIHVPVVADGRSRERTPGWGIEPIERYPYEGSAIVVWDSGAATIPVEPLAPREGFDPHSDPRADPEARRQKAAFLFEDQLIDVCGGEPCTAAATR